MRVLFYVSGHGYGHATRTSEVLRALVALRPDWTIHVRSNVPAHLVAGIDRVRFHPMSESLDPGVVEEADSLGVDVAATLRQVERHYLERHQRVAREVQWVAEHDISLIVADFPPLAGEVAAAAAVPCVGIGNFTWNWIYAPFFGGGVRSHLLDWIRDGYRPITLWLKLPFSHGAESESIGRVVDMPLVARRPRRDPADVLTQLKIDPADRRPRIVLAMRGRIPREARAAVADANPGWLFLHFDDHNAGSRGNERAITLTDDLLFTDVLNACDAAVSKFGYGMVSECIAAKKRLLCPPRRSFREDEIFERQVDRQLRVARISRDDFLAGRWSEALGRLLEEPVVEPTLAIDGADACANEITRIVAASSGRNG